MFDQTIRQLLAMYPKGATDAQLIWRLGAAGVRVNASELLTGLTTLADRGEIFRDALGRWRSAPVSTARPASGTAPAEPSRDRLVAARASWAPNEPVEMPPPAAVSGGDLPPWPALAGYYAATQRKDPRGRIQEYADRHGQGWQLIQATGPWWRDTTLRVPMEALPETFRETLTRGRSEAAALGWPVSKFPSSAGLGFLPGFIIPVDLRIAGPDLLLRLNGSEPIINPSWAAEVRRRTAWTEEALLDCLLPEGEDSDLGAISDRMRHALATIGGATLRPGDLAGHVSLEGAGLCNLAGLFLPQDTTFTRGTAEDLETMRGWSPDQLARSALGPLLGLAGPEAPPRPVTLDTRTERLLTDSQREAADTALAGPLAVVQGPPGTGKSEVILALLVSAVLDGRTVLFAAKNHQAIDEVESRLQNLVPDAPLLVRARDAEGERNVSFLDALSEIARSEPRAPSDDALSRRGNLLQHARELDEIRQALARRLATDLELSDLVERVAAANHHPFRPSATLLSRLLRALRRLLCRAGWARGESILGEAASIDSMQEKIQQLHAALRETAAATAGAEAELYEKAHALTADLVALMPGFAAVTTSPDPEALGHVVSRERELEFARNKSARRMSEKDARLVLRFRPIWAVSTLSAPARIPLVAGLFDYVVFDEASQCDVASALPLFARARRAVVVGDPMQLRFVPPLGNASEHALMDAAGLPGEGRAFIAQSINSLFDFCSTRPVARRVFLRDQFRSAPDIVGYLNDEFYSDRLIGRRDEESFRPPAGYKPGLAWHDVAGHTTREADGNRNRAESQAIAALLRDFARDPDFSGSVGVISPFNAQVAEIQARCEAELSPAERDRLRLRIATVDKFQGGEADVILFSLVITPTAPQSARTFLQKERRRLNVAVSRARCLCIVVGDKTFALSCGIAHVAHLANRATNPRVRHRPQHFDSSWERRLDAAMRQRGIQALPQYALGRRYLDFAIDPEGRRINVEVDGVRWHTDASGNRKVADRLRDQELRARGWTVLRFWVHELAHDMEACLDRIERELGR